MKYYLHSWVTSIAIIAIIFGGSINVARAESGSNWGGCDGRQYNPYSYMCKPNSAWVKFSDPNYRCNPLGYQQHGGTGYIYLTLWCSKLDNTGNPVGVKYVFDCEWPSSAGGGPSTVKGQWIKDSSEIWRCKL